MLTPEMRMSLAVPFVWLLESFRWLRKPETISSGLPPKWS